MMAEIVNSAIHPLELYGISPANSGLAPIYPSVLYGFGPTIHPSDVTPAKGVAAAYRYAAMRRIPINLNTKYLKLKGYRYEVPILPEVAPLPSGTLPTVAPQPFDHISQRSGEALLQLSLGSFNSPVQFDERV